MLTPGKSKIGQRYTCRPTPANHRLLRTAPSLGLRAGTTPTPIDHRPILRAVRNQWAKGYCFAFATALVKEGNCVFWSIARGGPSTPLGDYLSPDYVGGRTQLAEGTLGQDAGGSLGDSFAVGQSFGICPESFLPYEPNNKAHLWSPACDTAALPYRFGTPCTVSINPEAFAQVLSASHIIAMGFSVYSSFEDTGPDGVVKPVQSGEPLLGGHAVNPVGWELSPVTKTRYFIGRNSWGTSWGDQGYFYFDDSYLVNVFDAWTTA